MSRDLQNDRIFAGDMFRIVFDKRDETRIHIFIIFDGITVDDLFHVVHMTGNVGEIIFDIVILDVSAVIDRLVSEEIDGMFLFLILAAK